MDLTCYLNPGWAPLLRPAPATRSWMDDTPEAFAYRCLPLNIANAHGWELLNPSGFEAEWDGRNVTDAVRIRPDEGADLARAPVSLFGQGVLTFHVEGLFRTPPGWNLMVGGSPNRFKDAIAPLTGVIETDWSPFSFTMNWRFTRPHAPIRFEAFEPFCFLFPLQRGAVEAFTPRFEPVANDPGLQRRFADWSAARTAFHEKMAKSPPVAPADKWQKHYYQGVDASGQAGAADHRAKLRLKPFDASAVPGLPLAPATDLPASAPAAPDAGENARLRGALAKRDWLLQTLERQRGLSPAGAGIERRAGMGAEEFLEQYYAPGRPVILVGELAGWPALDRWSPDYLKAKLGAALDVHGACVTDPQALAPLQADLGSLDALLDPAGADAKGVMWIGAQGAFAPLHHDLTNTLIAQVMGRRTFKILPASEVGRIYNDEHTFSRIPDLDDPALDPSTYPALNGARAYELTLEPGEVLFLPFGWWHQARSLNFTVSLAYTNFRWPNDAHASWPT